MVERSGVKSRLIPRSLLFSEFEKSSVQLSPDGSLVGYLAKFEGQPAIWIANVTSPNSPRRLATAGPVAAWKWAFDGRHVIAMLHLREGHRLSVVPLAADAGPGDLALPDGEQGIVALSPAYPSEFLASVATESEAISGLYRVGLDGTAPARVMGLDDFDTWYCDRDLNVRAARKKQTFSHALYRRTPAGQWVVIAEYGWHASHLADLVSVSADGRTLFYIDNRGVDTAALKSMDVETGVETVRFTCPVADLVAGESSIHPDGSVQAVCSYFVRLKRYYLDDSLLLDFETLRTVHHGGLSHAGRSADDQTWLVRFMDGGPSHYYVYPRKHKIAHRLFTDQPALDPYPQARRHAAVVPARDGLPLPCDVYLPAGTDWD